MFEKFVALHRGQVNSLFPSSTLSPPSYFSNQLLYRTCFRKQPLSKITLTHSTLHVGLSWIVDSSLFVSFHSILIISPKIDGLLLLSTGHIIVVLQDVHNLLALFGKILFVP